jgi:uncharacterized membrane protein YeaQ/YmgE (transglycosylase-associated protein family)
MKNGNGIMDNIHGVGDIGQGRRSRGPDWFPADGFIVVLAGIGSPAIGPGVIGPIHTGNDKIILKQIINIMLQLIINLISGALGGNAAGAASNKLSLGPMLNSIVGLIGGGLGGQALSSLANSGGNMNAGSIIGGIISSGAGGAILTAIVGFIKGRLAGRS